MAPPPELGLPLFLPFTISGALLDGLPLADISSLFKPLSNTQIKARESATYGESPKSPQVLTPLEADRLQTLLQAALDGGQAADPGSHNRDTLHHGALWRENEREAVFF